MAVSHTLLSSFAALTAASLTAIPAMAEPDTGSPASAGIDYAPADFAQYNPQTALDMVNRIPGFLLLRRLNPGPSLRSTCSHLVHMC